MTVRGMGGGPAEGEAQQCPQQRWNFLRQRSAALLSVENIGGNRLLHVYHSAGLSSKELGFCAGGSFSSPDCEQSLGATPSSLYSLSLQTKLASGTQWRSHTSAELPALGVSRGLLRPLSQAWALALPPPPSGPSFCSSLNPELLQQAPPSSPSSLASSAFIFVRVLIPEAHHSPEFSKCEQELQNITPEGARLQDGACSSPSPSVHTTCGPFFWYLEVCVPRDRGRVIHVTPKTSV